MKKKTGHRLLSVLLLFSIFASLLPMSTIAVPAEEEKEERTPTLVDFIAGAATTEDIYGALDPSTVPEIIDYEEAVAQNHIARLYEDEGTDLNKIIFLNVDGSKTMYTFDFPVKYVDNSGNIQDISLEIAESTTNVGEFETAASNTVTTFSSRFADGISLAGNDTQIRLIPVLPSSQAGLATVAATDIAATPATAQRVDKNTVAYTYDTKTTVEYSLTYTGFKEDIVVSEYTGQTEYPFRLFTNGLALEEIEGSFFLVDDAGNIRAAIGDIIIFTADERNNAFGELEAVTVVENQEYVLNIVVDAEYLADPATVYPIRIDPTVKINYNYGAGAVEDITISTNTNYSGTYDYLFVGRRQTEGISRILLRFPGLDVSELASATITSAYVRIRDMMCEDDPLDVSCHIFTGSEWSESSATWANCSPNSYVSTPLSTNTLKWSIGDTFSNKHWYQFDVTEAVQGWVDGNYNQNKGFLFKVADSVENGDEILNRTFGSYNRTNYRPYLSVTYTFEEEMVTVREGATYALPTNGLTGTATWTSSNTVAATVDANGVVTGVKAGNTIVTATVNGTVERSFHVYVAIVDGVYYIKNNRSGYYLSVEDSDIMPGSAATQEVKRTTHPEKYSQLWKITYLANGMYSIRPMHQLNRGLSAYGGNAKIYSISEEDSMAAVAADCQWTIIFSAYGYVLRHEAQVASTLVPENLSTAADATITVAKPTSTSTSYIWTLENVTYTIKNNIIFYDKENKVLTLDANRYIAPEETKTSTGLKLYASFVSRYTNEQDIVWSVGDSEAAVIDPKTGEITGSTPSSMTTVRAFASCNGLDYSETYWIYVTAVPNGTYYLRNKETEMYAGIGNQTAVNGAVVQQWEVDGTDSQKWKVTHRGDGAYTIRTAATTNSLYMGVSGNSTASGASVVLRTGTVQDGMIWDIQTTASGAYKLIPKSGETANLAFAANGDNPFANGVALQQQIYTSDTNYEEEWILHRDLDPFHSSNVVYIHYTRITGTNISGGQTDHTVSIIKSQLLADEYCVIRDNIYEGYYRELYLNDELKATLNNLEAGYQDHYHVIPGLNTTTDQEGAAHAAKGETDQLVDAGYFATGSSEYYGVWAYNYISTLNLLNYWKGAIDTATSAFQVYLTLTTFYYSYLSTLNTTNLHVTSTQYQNASSVLDDIDDAMYGMNYTNRTTVSADSRNTALAQQGYTDPLPYKPQTPVVQYQQTSSTQYVRVFTIDSNGNKIGRWLMKYSDIQGLTPTQIQSKFALQTTPTHYCFVNVPAGTTIYIGAVNESSVIGTLQYELAERLSESYYGTSMLLP